MAEETKETKKIIPESKKKKKRKKKKVLLKVSVVFLLLVVIGWFTFGAKVMKLRSEAKELVAQSSEDTFKASQTSIVYDTNGKQLLKFKGEKDVYYLKYKELPVYVIAAVISVEDRNFYKHSGVDYKGISRAAVSYVVHKGAITQGGSTLTQQLAKTVFLNRQKTWKRKVKEIFMAVELEKKYSKEQILEFYLNNVYYSNGYYGIQAASQGYFRKDAKNLTMSEAAFLSAIPNNPTIYDPRTNKENTIKRRNKILKDMYEQNLVKKDQYEEALNEDIDVKKAQKTKTEKKNYIETYVIHCATKEIMKQKGFEFKDDFSSNSEKKKYQEEYDKMYAECKRTLYSAGYHIYTSIDPDVQKQLQKSVNNALSGYTEKDKNGIYKAQASGTCIDNDTGKVVAIVGGREQKNIGYTLNRAYQSPRQPGSAIKPLLVYAPALEHGWSAGSTVNDSPMASNDKHRVRNSHGSYSGQISLRRAVQKSSNVATMRIYEQLTPKTCLKYLEEMNFKYLEPSDYKYYTTCIGGFRKGTTAEEMAAGYATLKNNGVYREPTCITKITTSDGDEVMSSSTKKRRVYSTSAAKQMTDVLKSVVTGGTGVGAKVPNVDTAGKTGTTNDNRDGWFCGYTPYYTTAIWVGRDDYKIMPALSGASYPKTIWSNFMNMIHSEYSSSDASGTMTEDYSNYDGGDYQATTSTQATSTGRVETTTEAPTTAAPTTAAPATATEAPTTASQSQDNNSSKEQ
ncbi:transglycosylase domain-containing protein [Anaerostipes sp.]|jgi:penicillin-binding protein 1A|uniref:transglycosylase domain-containing protein n=1 Tax=Anaerostipes sp. TaxID=1872530 RepID=UPI00396751E2